MKNSEHETSGRKEKRRKKRKRDVSEHEDVAQESDNLLNEIPSTGAASQPENPSREKAKTATQGSSEVHFSSKKKRRKERKKELSPSREQEGPSVLQNSAERSGLAGTKKKSGLRTKKSSDSKTESLDVQKRKVKRRKRNEDASQSAGDTVGCSSLQKVEEQRLTSGETQGSAEVLTAVEELRPGDIGTASRKPPSAESGKTEENEDQPASRDDAQNTVGDKTAVIEDEDPLEGERLERTLFVGNVSQSATRRDIKRLFKDCAPVETVRIRNIRAANPKIPKKAALFTNKLASFADTFSAYVVFKKNAKMSSIIEAACKKRNLTLFMEKHIIVTPASHSKGGPIRQSVFLGNLPFDCKDEELVNAFISVAKVNDVQLLNVRVNRDKDTGVGRGTGFVAFDDVNGVQACLNLEGQVKIRDRVIRMERALKTKKLNTKTVKGRKFTRRGNYKGIRKRNTPQR